MSRYISRLIRFKFSPETPDELPSWIEGTTSNGVCAFTWDPETITFEVAKYGEGDSLSITMDNSHEMMESLKKALSEWRAAMTH